MEELIELRPRMHSGADDRPGPLPQPELLKGLPRSAPRGGEGGKARRIEEEVQSPAIVGAGDKERRRPQHARDFTMEEPRVLSSGTIPCLHKLPRG